MITGPGYFLLFALAGVGVFAIVKWYKNRK